jgi:hypothetical protein
MANRVGSHQVENLSTVPNKTKILEWVQSTRLIAVLSFVVLSLGSFSQLAVAQAQTGAWTWVGGGSTLSGSGNRGVYGTLGVPAPGNMPGGREGAIRWTDRSGNFWLFGGYGADSVGSNLGYLNDLWEYNVATGEWTWVSGSSTLNGFGHPGVYGTLGVPASGNIPGGRVAAVSWTDIEGNFWMFGGSGKDTNGSFGFLNDLWEFNPSIGQWSWMGGSNLLPNSSGYGGQPGVYGTFGVSAPANIPGGRASAVSWVDSAAISGSSVGWATIRSVPKGI